MHPEVLNQIELIAQERIDERDAAHNFDHARRVMNNALRIASTVQADEDILIPASLFHDVVMYPKNDARSANASAESARMAASILSDIRDFPSRKTPQVVEAIELCSFLNNSPESPIEVLILQDADRLEATGAIAVMRTFWSAGQMNQPLYHSSDPFAKSRVPDGLEFGLDLFFTRLLRVTERMNTVEGQRMARERTEFLTSFMKQFESEWASFNGE